jgi:hypothetical protein
MLVVINADTAAPEDPLAGNTGQVNPPMYDSTDSVRIVGPAAAQVLSPRKNVLDDAVPVPK